jgi:conjugative relaxase-like TrwC/TraI family protein
LKSAKAVADYYDDVKSLADYHSVAIGIWGGKGAELLGLRGEVLKEAFVDLLENRNPTTKKPLTARTKKNRRAAYEITVSVPKSLSLYMEFSGDKFFERLPRETFLEVMAEVEAYVQARVRKGGADYNRTTENLTFAWFIHRESRPVDGISDCHWHIHAIIPNCTFDATENCWKAAQFGDIKMDAPYFQACFNSTLAEKLLASGYSIRRTESDFEMANVSRELIDRFSRRHHKIKQLEKEQESELKESAVTWSKKSGISYTKALGGVKAQLGKKNREKKSTALLKDEELRQNWRERMTPEELNSLRIDKVRGPSVGFLESEVSTEISLETLEEVANSPHHDRELHVAAALLRRGLGKISVAAAKMWAQARTASTIGIPIVTPVVKSITQSPFAKFILSRMPTVRPGVMWGRGKTRETVGRER